jgi:hypothetical protein
MTPQRLMRRLAARKLAADRLAIDLILDCERAASGRNGKRADPARLDGNRLASISTRRGPIARDFAARAALSRDRRHRGRSSRTLTPNHRRAQPLRRAHRQFVIN